MGELKNEDLWQNGQNRIWWVIPRFSSFFKDNWRFLGISIQTRKTRYIHGFITKEETRSGHWSMQGPIEYSMRHVGYGLVIKQFHTVPQQLSTDVRKESWRKYQTKIHYFKLWTNFIHTKNENWDTSLPFHTNSSRFMIRVDKLWLLY